MWYGIIACEVAYFHFQANGSYGTWSIDFGEEELILEMLKKGMKRDKWDQVLHSFSPPVFTLLSLNFSNTLYVFSPNFSKFLTPPDFDAVSNIHNHINI